MRAFLCDLLVLAAPTAIAIAFGPELLAGLDRLLELVPGLGS